MANLPNQYVVPSLPNLDPRVNRVIQDLADRVNYLTTELDRVKKGMPEPGARKENPTEGIITIPTLSNVYTVIWRDMSVVGNVGAGLDSLHTFTLPTNYLATDGDSVKFLYVGNLATNDNDKRIQISIDGQVIENTGVLDIDQGWWRVSGTYTRLTSTSVVAELHEVFGFLNQLDGAAAQSGSSQRHVARNSTPTVSNLGTTPVVMLVQAEGVANNDITQNLSIIELCQQRGNNGFVRVSKDGVIVSYTNPA